MFGLIDSIQVLNQAHPGRPGYVGRVRSAQAVSACNSPYGWREQFDESVPCAGVARYSGLNQGSHHPISTSGLLYRRHLPPNALLDSVA